MRKASYWSWRCCDSSGACVGYGDAGRVHAAADDEAAKPEFYMTKVKPIFEDELLSLPLGE